MFYFKIAFQSSSDKSRSPSIQKVETERQFKSMLCIIFQNKENQFINLINLISHHPVIQHVLFLIINPSLSQRRSGRPRPSAHHINRSPGLSSNNRLDACFAIVVARVALAVSHTSASTLTNGLGRIYGQASSHGTHDFKLCNLLTFANNIGSHRLFIYAIRVVLSNRSHFQTTQSILRGDDGRTIWVEIGVGRSLQTSFLQKANDFLCNCGGASKTWRIDASNVNELAIFHRGFNNPITTRAFRACTAKCMDGLSRIE
mmetsp:Transcript_26625/g.41334  ORF Transcript_26625/g.41334 Transcript_26625/m.41334 type:complete len:259 (+) Transcript_26625:23-799(+)